MNDKKYTPIDQDDKGDKEKPKVYKGDIDNAHSKKQEKLKSNLYKSRIIGIYTTSIIIYIQYI